MILEGPVLPVDEGHNVTLRCIDQTSSGLMATFYKDGVSVGSSPTAQISLHGVVKSDQGRYTCSLGAGESAQSWLVVRGEARATGGFVSGWFEP